ncbi:MAG: adenosylcobalamin-dependent ribonucleoside-diphosphate reductase [Deltaproteobacteria bacterium]|nr:MAG: adenosylcobalamin-dependent ribonucleoside-diphosphate reductase [Deltaproteobacteria bacterium]
MDALFDEAALKVLEKRYLARDATGAVVETPEAMLERVAGAIAAADARVDGSMDEAHLARRFYDLMAQRLFFPNSPALAAGRPEAQLAACFVLPLEDSLESIYRTLGMAARIHQSGGGTGFDFSVLRPAGARVRSTGGVASGPVSFIELFNVSTEVIKQGGVRRGANMAVLRVDHPDVFEFIRAKSEPGRLRNFNLSVALTDAFVEALGRGDEIQLTHPAAPERARHVAAEEIFSAIAECAWEGGEPGLLFIDRINERHTCPHVGTITATNPCGEQPLLAFESCTLGSVNLSLLCAGGEVDWERLREVVRLAVRFLDDVIEATSFPFEPIEHMTRLTRKIGLGVMGFADLLVDLGIPYDSEEALTLADEVMGFIHAEARVASADLAKRRGPFPAWNGSRLEAWGVPPQRNATLTTVAPTGTISILAGCSPSIEPLYAVEVVRHVLDGETLVQEQPRIRELLVAEGLDPDETLAKIRAAGSPRRTEGLPETLKRRIPTTFDIAPEWHVRMQAAFQRHCDAAVSKTINLPADAPLEAVRHAFELAWELGCKGITVFRDRSRGEQVLTRLQVPYVRCPDCA